MILMYTLDKHSSVSHVISHTKLIINFSILNFIQHIKGDNGIRIVRSKSFAFAVCLIGSQYFMFSPPALRALA